jgi:pimeloyl-ACP methyl ester carboxylesterase
MKRSAEQAFSRLWGIREDGSHLQEAWQFWKDHDPALPHGLLNRIVLDHVRAGGGDGRTGPYGFIAVFRSHLDQRLSEIKAPTLILWGTHDLTTFGFPKENEEKVNRAIPRCRAVSIEGGTFALPNMMPEKFARLILEFLGNPGI